MSLVAYKNDPALKKSVLAEMAMHRKADNLVKGSYWDGHKGCAVGCLLKSGNHSEYEEKFGIPEMLARLEDVVFEGLPINDAKKWPERFLKSINVGSDLSLVGWKFLHWNLTVNIVVEKSENKEIEKINKNVRAAIKQCAAVLLPLMNGKKLTEKQISAAWSAARSAWVAAWSAEGSSARAAAESAAAAWSAESARSALAAARAAAAAARSAESAAWQKMADKIIELLEEAA